MTALDQTLLKEILHYDPDTGAFTWRTCPWWPKFIVTRNAGKPAGTVNHQGYVMVKIQQKLYLGHRLAWLYMTGDWPPDGLEIDHINRDGSDNRLSNLRLATRKQNAANTGMQKNNLLGFKGVSRHHNKFMARGPRKEGGTRYIGLFDTAEEAHEAYLAATREVHGEFSGEIKA